MVFGALGFGAFSFVADSVMHGFMGEKPDPRIAKKEKEEELVLAAEVPPTVEELQLLIEKKRIEVEREGNSVRW